MSRHAQTVRELVATAAAMLTLAALAAGQAAAEPIQGLRFESAPTMSNHRQIEQAAAQTMTMNHRQIEEAARPPRFVSQRQMELMAEESFAVVDTPDNRADRRLPGLSAPSEAPPRSGSSGFELGGVEIGLSIAAALALLGGTGIATIRRRSKVAHP